MLRALQARDGALPERSWPHDVAACRYAEQLKGRACPWCQAARRRATREQEA